MYVGKRREGGLPEMGNDQKIVWGGNIYNRGAQGGGGVRHFGSADRRETIASWPPAYHTTATRWHGPNAKTNNCQLAA
jgi:hypothetical protein